MNKKIIWVDDNVELMNDFESIFNENGFDLIKCPTISLALKSILNDESNLLLLDVNFPNNDQEGIDFLELLKEIKKNLKVIIFTAHPNIKHAIKGFKDLEIVDYISKLEISPDYSNIKLDFFDRIKQSFFSKSIITVKENAVEEKISERNVNVKKKIFIGSSSEGLRIARRIQLELEYDAICEIWNQGTFELGDAYLESLEKALNKYDIGIFIFTPDDSIEIRGIKKKIARDNVIFELGMFIGKLSRKRAFLVHPRDSEIHVLSDMEGISIASYDPTIKNLSVALGPICEKIRIIIQKIGKGNS